MLLCDGGMRQNRFPFFKSSPDVKVMTSLRYVCLNEESSRSGEFHPQPLTEPYLTVSHHTALHNNLMATNHIPNGQTLRERILLPSLTKQSISSYFGFCTCSSPIWLTSHSNCQTEGSKPIY